MSHTLFVTHSGKLVDLRDIKEEDICLEDISHHLTNIQRFGGCLPLGVKYSVATHSLNCVTMSIELFPGEIDLWRTALMHDATEAYLGDVVSGLKQCLKDYTIIESNLWESIKSKYNLKDYSRVGEIDKRIMLDEAKALLPEKYFIYLKNQNYQPYDVIKIVPDKYPHLTKKLFLETCSELSIND